MKQARYKEPLPLAVIEAARAGDAGAVEQVLQYYNGYINKLCKVQLLEVPFIVPECSLVFNEKPLTLNNSESVAFSMLLER